MNVFEVHALDWHSLKIALYALSALDESNIKYDITDPKGAFERRLKKKRGTFDLD